MTDHAAWYIWMYIVQAVSVPATIPTGDRYTHVAIDVELFVRVHGHEDGATVRLRGAGIRKIMTHSIPQK